MSYNFVINSLELSEIVDKARLDARKAAFDEAAKYVDSLQYAVENEQTKEVNRNLRQAAKALLWLKEKES